VFLLILQLGYKLVIIVVIVFGIVLVEMAADSIPNKELDQWIENLSNCKQLEEVEVKRLTDKVSRHCDRCLCRGFVRMGVL